MTNIIIRSARHVITCSDAGWVQTQMGANSLRLSEEIKKDSSVSDTQTDQI